MSDKMKDISAIENKYGLVLFRMGLTHLVDVGVRHLTDEYIEASVNQIIADGETNKANGIIDLSHNSRKSRMKQQEYEKSANI